MELVALQIDGTAVQVPAGTTVLEAARAVDIPIPTLCTFPGANTSGYCRVCLVEVEGTEQLLPACTLPVEPGMRVRVNSREILEARRMSVELLVAQHPLRCLTCYRSGKCQLQDLARQYGIQESRFVRRDTVVKNGQAVYPPRPRDDKSPAISHDPNMCILCGLCVEACRAIQHVDVIDFAYRGCQRMVQAAFGQSLNDVECTACGQCIQVCPVNAFYETSHVYPVQQALAAPEMHVIGLLSPMVSVSIGEEFGLDAGTLLDQQLIATLKDVGFAQIFDVAVGGDLIILEEAYQLLNRVKNKKRLPMISSASPAWVKYIEHFYPDLLPLLSSCKSPAQALAALIKSYYAEQHHLAPEQIFVVSLSPCTAEKFERTRPQLIVNGSPAIDACLTTKEIARLLQLSGGDRLLSMPPHSFDPPFDHASGAGELLCAAGGMAEAVFRTFYELFTEKKLKTPDFPTLRETTGFKEVQLKVGAETISIAIVHGTGNVATLIKKMVEEKKTYHYIEIKGCPSGCAQGGGEPLPGSADIVRARTQALYDLDAAQPIRKAHDNPNVKQIYEQFLKKPASPEALKFLHTKFIQRQRYL